MKKEYLIGLGLEENVADEILENFNGEIKSHKISAKINEGLLRSGAYDSRTILPLLDMEKISFDENEITGLNEQLSSLKENSPYLFKTVSANSGLNHGSTLGVSEPQNMNSAIANHYSK